MTTALLIAAGYLAGSIPFGYWLVRAVKGADVRQVGSGNIGATNVWRAFGPQLGIPVILLDVGKGFVPALVGVLFVDELAAVLAGAAAMVGHWRPLFMGFRKGGKTVATAGGTFWAVAPLVALAVLVLWIGLFAVTRYASVASIGSAIALPVVSIAFGEPWPVVVFALGAAVAVVVLHRANIRRLRTGTEHRFALRRPSPTATR